MPGEEVRASNVHGGAKFVEECSMGIFSSWVHCTQFIVWVSLIAGVGYRVEQWGGKWDGTMGVANSSNWRCCSRLCYM